MRHALPIFITCGPAYEPVDEVRRITNFSTGKLGSLLCDAFTAAGYQVVCFRGIGATFPAPQNTHIVSFSTNQSLVEKLKQVDIQPQAIFHAAALSDFAVASVETDNSSPETKKKISSRSKSVKITLKPAQKVLPLLPQMFPHATIVGWKYELDGTREDALAKGYAQIVTCQTHACVVNGHAYGRGFGFLQPEKECVSIATQRALCEFLAQWIANPSCF